MREKDEITGLFRSRLSGTEMTVRDGFWEQLQEDAASPAAGRKRAAVLSPKYYRVAAAASVIFVLGAASAAFWYFSPKEAVWTEMWCRNLFHLSIRQPRWCGIPVQNHLPMEFPQA